MNKRRRWKAKTRRRRVGRVARILGINERNAAAFVSAYYQFAPRPKAAHVAPFR